MIMRHIEKSGGTMAEDRCKGVCHGPTPLARNHAEGEDSCREPDDEDDRRDELKRLESEELSNL